MVQYMMHNFVAHMGVSRSVAGGIVIILNSTFVLKFNYCYTGLFLFSIGAVLGGFLVFCLGAITSNDAVLTRLDFVTMPCMTSSG